MNTVKKKITSVLCTVVFLASIVGIPVTVLGASRVTLNDFNTNAFNTDVWKNASGVNLTNISAVQTNLMPAGYAIRNTSGNILVYKTLESDKTLNFSQNDYYISLYYHMTGAVTESSTNTPQHTLNFYDSANAEVAKAGIMNNTGYKPFVKMNGGVLYDGGGTVTNSPVVYKDKVYQLVIKVIGGTNPSMLMKVYDVGSGALVASPGKENVTGTASSKTVTKIGTNINTAWGGTQTISDLTIKEYTAEDKAAAVNVYKDMADITPSFGVVNASGLREIGTDISNIPTSSFTGANGSLVTWTSSDTTVIDNSGVVQHPAAGEEDAIVFLTANVSNGTATDKRSFAVTVKAQQASADLQALISERASLTNTFDGKNIPSVLPIEGTVATEASITWRSSEQSVSVDENGNVLAITPSAMSGDKQVVLTAELSLGAESLTQDITVNIPSSTGVMAIEQFEGLNNNDSVTSDYVPHDKGFTGAWKKNLVLTDNLTGNLVIQDTPAGKMMKHTTLVEPFNMYNKMNTPLDMDSESVYYASWKQSFSNQGNNSNKYLKVGFMNESAAEISSVWMATGLTDICKLGIKTGISTTYTADTATTINSGVLYNILYKVVSKPSSSDEFYIKIYPCGTQEPEEWTYSKTASLTGKYGYVFLSTSTALEGDIIRFGDFNIEKYNAFEASGAATVETAVKSYIQNGGEVPVLSTVTDNGALKQSLTNMLKLRDGIYFGDAKFTAAGTRLFKLGQSSIECAIDIFNDSGSDKVVSGYVYAALYNETENILENIFKADITNTNGTLAANSKITVPLVLQDMPTENLNNYKLKLLIWNDTMVPFVPAVSMNSNYTENY